MSARILALLARLPADHWGFDLVALALVAAGCAAVLLGVLPADQLPTALDAAVYLLGILVPTMATRGAALLARSKTASSAALAAARAPSPADALRNAADAAAALTVPGAPVLSIVKDDSDA